MMCGRATRKTARSGVAKRGDPMKLMRLLLKSVVLGLALPAAAQAQAFPARQVHLLVP